MFTDFLESLTKTIKHLFNLGPEEDYPKKVKNLKPGDKIFGFNDGTLFRGISVRVREIELNSSSEKYRIILEDDNHSFLASIPEISGNILAYTSLEQLKL